MTEQKTGLGRDVYLALAAVGWADGQLDQEEADAIVRTALEEGLEIDEIAEIEEATKNPIDIGVIDRKEPVQRRSAVRVRRRFLDHSPRRRGQRSRADRARTSWGRP